MYDYIPSLKRSMERPEDLRTAFMRDDCKMIGKKISTTFLFSRGKKRRRRQSRLHRRRRLRRSCCCCRCCRVHDVDGTVAVVDIVLQVLDFDVDTDVVTVEFVMLMILLLAVLMLFFRLLVLLSVMVLMLINFWFCCWCLSGCVWNCFCKWNQGSVKHLFCLQLNLSSFEKLKHCQQSEIF